MPSSSRLQGDGVVSLDHYKARLSVLVQDVVDDEGVDIEGVISFLDHYDNQRKPLDRIQANNMKGRKVGDMMKDTPRPRVATMAGDAPELAEQACPEREGREGDTQPMPKAVEGAIMHEVVIKALEDRLAVGIKRYGQPLRAFNGRDAAQDAFEEVLDLSVYLAQVRQEMAAMRQIISDVMDRYACGVALDGDLMRRMEGVLLNGS